MYNAAVMSVKVTHYMCIYAKMATKSPALDHQTHFTCDNECSGIV